MTVKKKTIYIHMGMYKTGTKSIQFFFTEQRDFLIEQKIYYPQGSGIDFYRHKQLFPVQKSKFAKIIADSQKKDCDTIVLSSDSLCRTGISDQCLEAIRAVAPDYEIKIIIYVKRLDNFCKEWYSEKCKRNMFDSPKSYSAFMNHLYKYKKYILFPSLLLDQCSRQIGKENVIARNYVKDTLADFCSILEVTLPKHVFPNKRYNPSPSHYSIPYFTPSMFSKLPHGYTEVQLEKKIRDAFKYTGPGTVPSDIIDAMSQEIEHLNNNYISDYKEHFSNAPLSVQFPELETDPYRVYMAELLHSIYRRVTWPERLLWRVASLFFIVLIQIPGLEKILLRWIPYVEKGNFLKK